MLARRGSCPVPRGGRECGQGGRLQERQLLRFDSFDEPSNLCQLSGNTSAEQRDCTKECQQWKVITAVYLKVVS